MTDPVTNVEIEDVLSSIRRLVSEKAQPNAQSSDQSMVNDFVAPDRLVLTQALRVPDGETMPQPTAQVLSEVVTDAVPEPVVVAVPQEELSKPRIVAVEALSETSGDGGQAIDAGQGLSSDVPEDQVTDPRSAEEVAAPEFEASEPVAAEAETPNMDEATLVAPETAPEAPEMPSALHQDLQSADAADEPLVLQQVLTTEAEAATALAEDPSETPAPDADPEALETVVPRASGEELETRIAEWEAVIANADDQFEPDGAGADDYAGTEVESLSWRDHSDPVTERLNEAREANERLEEAQPDDPAEEIVVDAVASEVSENFQNVGDDGYIDEEALRDMVGEIVRQELQGALGERITRNVRKLVRREIHRALSAGGLE